MSEPHTPETSRKHEVDAPPASPPSGKRLRTEQHKDDIKRAAIARSYDLPDQVSYRVLAESFADLKQYLIPESSSRSTIDFKNPDAVRVLNQAILAVHFDLCVILPPGNLCPTVANRLNYIKWLSTNVLLDLPPGPLSGLDVGTGASCIYPLLGVRYLPQSSFVGTDISKESVSVAIQNVTLSELHDRIDVFLNTDRLTTLPLNAPGFPLPKEDADGSVFTFSMCNPPFYEDNDERQRLKQMKHGMPSLSTTAKDGELFTQGGEEAFLTGMVDESVVLAKRIKWYTTMVGKKGTIALLKAKLRSMGAKQVREGTLVQGKTVRWVIAWSFFGQTRLCLDVQRAPEEAKSWFVAAMLELGIDAVPVEAETTPCPGNGSCVWYCCSASERTWTRRWRRQAALSFKEGDKKPVEACTANAAEPADILKPADGHAPVLRFKVSIAATSTLSANATNINMLVEPGFDCSDLMGLYNNLRRKLSELQ